MKRFSVVGLCILSLVGCAGKGEPISGILPKVVQARTGVIDFAKSDLQEASRIAHEADDRIAYTCWDYLITVVPDPSDTGSANGKVDGVATTFQRARNVVKRVGSGVSDDLRLNCGPLYLDVKDDISGIAGRIASIAAKYGVKGFSPF